MRTPILAVAALLALFALSHLPVASSAAAVAGVVLHAQQQTPPPSPPAQVDVQINHGARGWHVDPVWVAIGAIALLLLIVLIIMAARGSGGGTTTVVR